jgi:chorismate--pyruvate lyase
MKKIQNPNWQLSNYCHDALPFRLSPWLLHAGSFMERLKDQGANNPYIHVLQELWQIPFVSEAALLNLDMHTVTLVREVLILNEKSALMYARTIFPRETLTGKEQELAHLKNRSLGSVLFKDPSLERSEFEIACLQPGMAWHETVKQHVQIESAELWARRSIFCLHGKKILLTEVFLPEMDSLC